MRGKPCYCCGYAAEAGITPAGAGKTGGFRGHTDTRRDHPRRCGENSRHLTVSRSSLGSPPQVRGKLRLRGQQTMRTGITPAGAGKTACRRFPPVCYRDHPRRCGENSADRNSLLPVVGSPPQVRGKLEFENRLPFESGITPAGAGKTRQPPLNSRSRWDHPRRCGENLGKRIGNAVFSGITPAGAGKTFIYIRECATI